VTHRQEKRKAVSGWIRPCWVQGEF